VSGMTQSLLGHDNIEQ